MSPPRVVLVHAPTTPSNPNKLRINDMNCMQLPLKQYQARQGAACMDPHMSNSPLLLQPSGLIGLGALPCPLLKGAGVGVPLLLHEIANLPELRLQLAPLLCLLPLPLHLHQQWGGQKGVKNAGKLCKRESTVRSAIHQDPQLHNTKCHLCLARLILLVLRAQGGVGASLVIAVRKAAKDVVKSVPVICSTGCRKRVRSSPHAIYVACIDTPTQCRAGQGCRAGRS